MTELFSADHLEEENGSSGEEALLRRRAARLALRRTDAEVAEHVELLTFRVGAEQFALPVRELLGVVAIDRFTRVPGASPDLLGVIHVRGELVPLVDTGRLLRSPLGDEGPRYVLLCRGAVKLALGVDAVLGINQVSKVELRPLEQGSTSGYLEALLPDQTPLLRLTALLWAPTLAGASAS